MLVAGPELFTLLSNEGIGATITLFVILIAFWEVIFRIGTRPLVLTMWIAIISQLVMTTSNVFNWRAASQGADLNDILKALMIQSLFIIVFYAAIAFHAAYRALYILYPKSQYVWVVPTAVVVIEVILHGATVYFYFSERYDSTFTSISHRSRSMQIVLMAYIVLTEMLFFGITQYKIVESVSSLNKSAISPWHYVKSAIRCVMFGVAVTSSFLSSTEIWFEPLVSSDFIMIAPNLVLLVLLTDSNRIHDIINQLQHHRRPAGTVGGGGGAATARGVKNGGGSGNGTTSSGSSLSMSTENEFHSFNMMGKMPASATS